MKSELSIWERLAASFKRSIELIRTINDNSQAEYHHPNGQEQRRERRAKERKLTQVNNKRNTR